MTADRPEIALELRAAARQLAQHPLVVSEQDPDAFRLIRRHAQQLDRWFTQRFGCRLQISADSARLFKSAVVAKRRPLRTVGDSSRPFSQREYTMLALALAAVAAGPSVTSLRELIDAIRTAAIDAGVSLSDGSGDRRALVTALKWMIGVGLAEELHERVDGYVVDAEADAVLSVRPDRVALVPLPALALCETPQQVLDRSDQRQSTRSWMRSMLLEEPVLYRSDLSEVEWAELRRRLSDEADIFDEMFGLRLEARAEGVAVIDPDGGLSDRRFPAGGTVPQAALLLLDRLVAMEQNPVERPAVVEVVAGLVDLHRRHWSQRADDPERLTDEVIDVLFAHRLAEPDGDGIRGDGTRGDGIRGDGIRGDGIRLLPAAWRYAVEVRIEQLALL